MVAGYGLTTPTLDIVMAPALVKTRVTIFFLGFASVSGVARARGKANSMTNTRLRMRPYITGLHSADILELIASCTLYHSLRLSDTQLPTQTRTLPSAA